MHNQTLIKAVQLANGQSALAQKIKLILPDSKIRQGHVRKWLHSPNANSMPPGNWVLPICAAVEWAVTPHEMRPDLYPDPQDGLPVDKRQTA